MWRRAFVATTVALGGTVDDALAALPEEMPETMRLPTARTSPLDGFVAGLRAPTRPARATALAQALRDVVIAVDELRSPMIHRARILKNPSNAVPFVTADDLARRIPRVVMDAKAEAEKIVAGAEARAVAAAAAAGAEARESEIAKLAASALALREADEKRAARDLDRTVEVAVLLAERLVGEALAVAPERIGELAAAALQETRGSRKIRIEANPADVEPLGKILGELAVIAKVEASGELARGSLVVHTDIGKIDGTLRPQLDRLAVVLREAMSA